MPFRTLNAESIIQTLRQLHVRIEERFTGSGLGKVCHEAVRLAEESRARSEWISRPHILLRVMIGLFSLAALGLLIFIFRSIQIRDESLNLAEFLQMIEAGINETILFSAGLYFLISLEVRIKRSRALKALHEIRSLVHVVDMHQLTKDPARLTPEAKHTKSSPNQKLDNYDLSRYLDYCSELLSLLGKISALYAQHLEDPIVLNAVDEIEGLTTALSTKIWQKIMIISQCS